MPDLVAKTDIDRRLADLVEPRIVDMGFELVRLRFGGKKSKTLQIMAERPGGGIKIDECAEISREISALLDVENPIEGAYLLEVSSPGIDRPLTRLEDFNDWKGCRARIGTNLDIDGRRRFSGVLRGTSGEEILIEIDEGTIGLEFSCIEEASLLLTDKLDAQPR